MTGPNNRPAKRKVVEIEPEPHHTEIADSSRTVELLITGNSDYSKLKCKTESVKFKDTLMFQTRLYEYVLANLHVYVIMLTLDSTVRLHVSCAFFTV